MSLEDRGRNNNNSNSIGDFLKKYWFIITAVVTMSTAWGATSNRITTLEEAVKSNADTQAQVSQLQANQAAIDERTKAIQDTQKSMQDNQMQQQQLLQQILIRMPKGKNQ